MAKKKKKSGAKAKKARTERRFEPLATGNRWVVYACGAIGAAAMGAGTWGQFGPMISSAAGTEPFKYAPWILAGGAVLVGIAIWFGTSGEAAIRVGDPGIALEKGELRRLPWYGVEKVELAGGAVVATGKDDLGREIVVKASIASHPQAAAWIVREAQARLPKLVTVPDDADELPRTNEELGEVLTVEPVQVVGKHCAASGKIISYEPDARVCTRCERVYHKAHVPVTCDCGSSLAGFRSGAEPSSKSTKSSKSKEADDDDALAEAVATADEAPKKTDEAPKKLDDAPKKADVPVLEVAEKPQQT
jgi:hypothetical protein